MKNFFALFIAHALLAGFTCSLLFLTITKFSYNTAIIASLALAVYPPFVYHAVITPESTTLLLFLISLFSYRTSKFIRKFFSKEMDTGMFYKWNISNDRTCNNTVYISYIFVYRLYYYT